MVVVMGAEETVEEEVMVVTEEKAAKVAKVVTAKAALNHKMVHI